MKISNNFNNANTPKFGAQIINKGKTWLPPTVTEAFSKLATVKEYNGPIILLAKEYKDPLYGSSYKIKMMIPSSNILGKIKNLFNGWIPLSNGAHFEEEWVERIKNEYLLAPALKALKALKNCNY